MFARVAIREMDEFANYLVKFRISCNNKNDNILNISGVLRT